MTCKGIARAFRNMTASSVRDPFFWCFRVGMKKERLSCKGTLMSWLRFRTYHSVTVSWDWRLMLGWTFSASYLGEFKAYEWVCKQ